MTKANPGAEMINGGIWIRCEHCGKESDVQRTTAFFCDGKCKNAFHNAKRKRKKDIAIAFHSLETLIQNMPKQGDSNEWDALTKMQEMIKAALWAVEA